MKKGNDMLIKLGILAFLICMICIPVVLAETAVAGSPGGDDAAAVTSADENAPEEVAADAVAPEATQTVSAAGTKLATPVLVSPYYNQHFYHYPRTTTLAWKPVAGATGYLVEKAYSDGTWHAYPVVTITAPLATTHTFDFIGDQPGRWRVTAIDSTGIHPASSPSAWRIFYYSTGLTLTVPVKVSPLNGTHFYNYPRTTTLTWKPVAGASGYTVETQYYYGVWSSSSSYTASTPSYTFDFVGAQPGRWRVKAEGTGIYRDSDFSTWRYFTYHV